MVGEHPTNPDSEDESGAVDLEQLMGLVDALDDENSAYPGTQGRQDWALEREYEIERLEKENDELRRLLGIDPESISATGMDMVAEIARMDAPRHPELSERTRNASNVQLPPGDSSYWEANGNGNGGNGVSMQQQIFQAPVSPIANSLPQQQKPQNAPSVPLQRMDLPRMLQGNRRTGMFGGGQAPRGLVVGTGRGIPNAPSVPMQSPTSNLSLWQNQPPSPATSSQENVWPGVSVEANQSMIQ